MTDTIFPDISEFQPNADMNALRASGVEAIAVRVCYGNAHIDHNMPIRRDQVRGAGFTAVMWYLFLRPNQDAQSQFNAFTSVIPSLGANEAVFVDWEADGSAGVPSPTLRDQMLAMFDNFYHQPTGLYASASLLAANSTDHPQWVASYGVSQEPAVKHFLWQYTDGKYTSGQYAPVNFVSIGKCDTDVFHGTANELCAAITANGPAIQIPIPAPVPMPLAHTGIVEDGNFGAETVRALQTALNKDGANLVVDGNYGPATMRMLQARLNATNGPVAIDGNVGRLTIMALQRHVHTAVDGQWGPNTTRALQNCLNTGGF